MESSVLAAPSQEPSLVFVGTAMIDITPPLGIDLCGYVERDQPSTGVHDPLFARALFLQTESEKLLWVHADVIGFDSEFVSDVSEEIAKQTGLRPGTDILLSASHTHSGPPTLRLLGCGELSEEHQPYLAQLKSRLVEVATGATSEGWTVEMVGGQAICDLAIDRRGGDYAHIDPFLSAIGFRIPGRDEYVAVLANYAIHPVVLGPENREISGDLLGMAAEELRRTLPGNPIVLFTNGACGNLNPPARRSFEDCAEWASQLAESAKQALEQAPVMEPVLASVSRTIRIPTMAMVGPDLNEAIAHLTSLFEGEDTKWNVRSRKVMRRWVLEMLDQEGTQLEVEVQCLKIGDFKIACIGAEVFSLMTARLRKRLGQNTMVVGYANGNIGYLCPESAYEEGGYEVESAFMYYGKPPIRSGAFETVLERLNYMLTTL